MYANYKKGKYELKQIYAVFLSVKELSLLYCKLYPIKWTNSLL